MLSVLRKDNAEPLLTLLTSPAISPALLQVRRNAKKVLLNLRGIRERMSEVGVRNVPAEDTQSDARARLFAVSQDGSTPLCGGTAVHFVFSLAHLD